MAHILSNGLGCQGSERMDHSGQTAGAENPSGLRPEEMLLSISWGPRGMDLLRRGGEILLLLKGKATSESTRS
jgi:hypothetical protein